MEKRPERREVAEALAKEHAALRAEIKHLNSDLDELAHGPAGATLRDQLLEDLRAFRERLRNHFQLEETDGYLGDAADRTPGTQRQVDEIVEEHRQFERKADDLIEQLEGKTRGGSSLATNFETQLRVLLGRLAIHESKENALFLRVVYREEGGGD